MSYQLSDLLDDSRLQRLFLSKEHHCALQLWVLQVEKENIVETQLVYGRLVPYSFSNNSWSFSDKDTSQRIDNFRASVTQLNLLIDSSKCRELLKKLCDGHSINNISEALNLKILDNLSKRFGNTILIKMNSVFRPAIYLLNRDASIQNSLLSPHGGAGALSAAISCDDKRSIFFFCGNYSVGLTSLVLKRLKEDTGMDFGDTDINRLGELELLVFPTLDDSEKNLLSVERTKYDGLIIKFTSSQVPAFNRFQFNLVCENNNQVFSSKIGVAQSIGDGVFEYNFDIDEKLFKITDATKIDVFGFNENNLTEGYLCCSWRITYIKEVNFRMHVIGNQSKTVKFDWLEKTVSSKMGDRVEAALTLAHSGNISENRIMGDMIDPWTEENRTLKTIFHKLNPPKSSGKFFIRSSNGEGKLLFVEWFKELLVKYPNNHIAIFDPYFEDVGLNLLMLSASSNAEYSIFRSLPKPRDSCATNHQKTDNLVKIGVDNLVTNCEQNRNLLHRKKIKIYGLKEGYLHDRYILVIGDHGLPIEGYHLSNSFQKATENHPLLVTPIPIDVLYEVNQYTFDLIKSLNKSSTLGGDNGSISIIFDSNNISIKNKIYEPLEFLNNELSGEILSVWLKQPLLKGRSGDELINKMNDLGVIKNKSLHDLPMDGLFLCFAEIEGELDDFMEKWKIIGEILARTITNDSNLEKMQFESNFLLFLSKFLSKSFQRNYFHDETEISVIDPSYFKKTLKDLLQSSVRKSNFFQSTKYSVLTWAEFFTIKYMWKYDPKSLITIINKELAFQPTDLVKLSLLGQIVSEIASTLEFRSMTEEQLTLLVESKIALLKWLGLNSIEQSILSSSDFSNISNRLSNLDYKEKLQFIGWFLNRNSEKSNYAAVYEAILKELWNTFPEKIPYDDLVNFIDAARGHMGKLIWAGMWLFKDIIQPLLDRKSISFDDACKIWLNDFIEILKLAESNRSLLFTSEREGNLINICAYLWANSSPSYQLNSMQNVKAILYSQRRIIQRPLASTSNWSLWDEALKISMWISSFTKLCRYYLNQLNIDENEQLDTLLELSYHLAMTRPLEEWSTESELIKFSEWIDNLY